MNDGRVEGVLTELERWGAARRWVGPDPYEGLNSVAGRLARGARPRQALTQAYKRSPWPPPWPLSAPQRPNAKALALALSGYVTEAGRALRGAGEFIAAIPEQLGRLNLHADHGGAAWGYHFDTQTRHLYYDRATPNAIATCFVVGALCDTATATGDERATRMALAARPYLLGLARESPHGPFFAYVERGSELIHNANVMVCGALARLHGLAPDAAAERSVRAAVATTLAHQPADGLWRYGEAPNLGWVDNFHTAYILEGLIEVSEAYGIGDGALEPGLDAWRERLFEPDGWARYYPDRHFPLEVHCSASAIDLLCRVHARAGGEEHLELARRIAQAAIRELWLPQRGRFGFRRTRRGLNQREFMRWTNAPMFRALARLVSATGGPARATAASTAERQASG